jgi:hypothetical protein
MHDDSEARAALSIEGGGLAKIETDDTSSLPKIKEASNLQNRLASVDRCSRPSV